MCNPGCISVPAWLFWALVAWFLWTVLTGIGVFIAWLVARRRRQGVYAFVNRQMKRDGLFMWSGVGK
jgi:hypothetical protein